MAEWLTDSAIAALTYPTDKKDALIFDALLLGFAVRVTKAGTKILLLQYKLAGRVKRVVLGAWNTELTFAQGREKAQQIRILLRQREKSDLELISDEFSEKIATTLDTVIISEPVTPPSAKKARGRYRHKYSVDRKLLAAMVANPGKGGKAIAGQMVRDASLRLHQLEATAKAINRLRKEIAEAGSSPERRLAVLEENEQARKNLTEALHSWMAPISQPICLAPPAICPNF